MVLPGPEPLTYLHTYTLADLLDLLPLRNSCVPSIVRSATHINAWHLTLWKRSVPFVHELKGV